MREFGVLLVIYKPNILNSGLQTLDHVNSEDLLFRPYLHFLNSPVLYFEQSK
jgi:hypothetical protein